MSDSLIIAQVETVNPMYAELRPAFRVLDSGDWDPISNAEQEFPDRGRLIWFHRLKKPSCGSVWKIECQTCPTYNGTTKRDRFSAKVETTREIYEVIDLTKFGDAECLQELLIGTGLPIRDRNNSAYVLRMSDRDFIGPVELDFAHGNCRFSEKQDLTRIPYHDLSDADLMHPQGILTGRVYIHDSNRLKQSSRVETWESDVELIRKIAQRLRKLDQRKFNELGITYKVFDAYIDAVETAQLTPEMRQLERSRARRLASIKDNVEFDRQLLEDAAAFLKKQPSVEKELQESIEAEKQRVRNEMAVELRDSKVLLAHLNEEVGKLQKELDGKAAEVSRQVLELEDTMQKRLLAAMEQPAECLTDIAIFSTAFKQIGVKSQRLRSIATDKLPSSPPNTIIQNTEVLHDLLHKNLARLDANLAIAKQLHAAFLSGHMPILIGSRAIEALKAYDMSVGNGSALWVPVSIRTVTASDILQYDEVGHWLEEAFSTESIRLLILDGANNAGAESALTPVASCYSESWHHSQLRRLTFQIGGELKRSTWPKNVLVAAISNAGPTTLPLPDEFWDHSMPVGFNTSQRFFGHEYLHPFNRELGLTTGQVDVATWSTWRLHIADQDIRPIESLLGKFASKHDLSREIRDQAVCFYCALRFQGLDEKNSIELSTLSCILPRLNEDEITLRELILEVGFDERYANEALVACKLLSELQLK